MSWRWESWSVRVWGPTPSIVLGDSFYTCSYVQSYVTALMIPGRHRMRVFNARWFRRRLARALCVGVVWYAQFSLVRRCFPHPVWPGIWSHRPAQPRAEWVQGDGVRQLAGLRLVVLSWLGATHQLKDATSSLLWQPMCHMGWMAKICYISMHPTKYVTRLFP